MHKAFGSAILTQLSQSQNFSPHWEFQEAELGAWKCQSSRADRRMACEQVHGPKVWKPWTSIWDGYRMGSCRDTSLLVFMSRVVHEQSVLNLPSSCWGNSTTLSDNGRGHGICSGQWSVHGDGACCFWVTVAKNQCESCLLLPFLCSLSGCSQVL